MGFVRGLKRLGRDLRHFDIGFQKHRFAGKQVIAVPVRGVGKVYVRPGNSDIDTIRNVFAGLEYDLSYPAVLKDRVAARYNDILGRGLVPVIVDAGANIGAASLYFAKEYPNAHIVAVEPDPGNFEILEKNTHDLTRCTVHRAAIGSVGGFVSVDPGEEQGLGWAMTTTRANHGTPVMTIHDAVAGVNGGEALIVKVDIEGFESDLFASGLDWLDHVEIVMIEPHDWMKPGERTSHSFQRAIASRSFEIFIKGENLIYARA